MKGKKGFVMVLALLLMLAVTLLALAAMSASTMSITIERNRLSGAKAFWNAESGISFTIRAMNQKLIEDTKLDDITWNAYLSHGPRPTSIGCGENDNFVSCNTPDEFAAKICHLSSGGKVVERYKKPMYVVDGHGYDMDSHRNVTVYLVTNPVRDVKVKAALSTNGDVEVDAASTVVNGIDLCGGKAVAGIEYADAISGNPNIDKASTVRGDPKTEKNSAMERNLDLIEEYVKDFAGPDRTYTFNTGKTVLTNMDMDQNQWGTFPSDPGTPPEEPALVYINAGQNEVTIDSTEGAGILFVRGNLKVGGGFHWYGLVVVTGDFTYIGGGEQMIMGAVMTGTSHDNAVVSGNAFIQYCSKAINFLKRPEYRRFAWKEGI